jgi:predicted glycogen debranching enzyme
MDEIGLLHAGDEATQLTWMDVSIEGRPVTPRSGFAVDINALWFNALSFACHLASVFEDDEMDLKALVEKSRNAFNWAFWVEGENYLGDVYSGGVLDTAVRPNQILAVSLPYTPITADRGKGVVKRVEKELLVPRGIRTLSPEDPAYRGCYRGDPAERDQAYHQGTAWPWLLGHFGEAYLRVAEDREAAKGFLLKKIIEPINQHLHEAGLGLVSEICDGDPPYRPDGCIAQAWSSAELIRLIRLMNEPH